MKIQLIAADPSLAQIFYEYRQDPINIRYNPLLPSTVEALKERLAKASSDLSHFNNADSFFWFIQLESKLVGTISLQNLNKMMMTAEIGYTVACEARGRGIATMAVYELTKNVFAQTPLRKIIAYVHEDNLASRKVLEKIGYKNEGLLREHYLINNEPVNEVVYGILKKECI
jgi:ribosomal-protein-alanine N-acetyltransferase